MTLHHATSDPLATAAAAHAAADAVARRSYGKLVAFLAARTHDLASAEDALADAFAAALGDWPHNGTPANPEAWLLTVARRKLIDASRRHATAEAASPELQLIAEHAQVDADSASALAVPGAASSGESAEGARSAARTASALSAVSSAGTAAEIPDRRLALMFACAHPAIDPAVRAPLILQTILGLDAKRIASAFLVSPASMGKRLVRAKEKIRVAGIPFEIPGREDLPARIDAVLDAIYAAFTEGWSDPAGADAVRADLTGEALFLARLVADLLPGEPEALGLLALILFAHSRRRARRNAAGEFVPLAEQDISLWDGAAVGEANAALAAAGGLGRVGRYQLEAAVQSAHAHRCITGAANWPDIVALYDALFALTQSPVVAINRAVALAEVQGAGAALGALPNPADDPRLETYQPYWAARAELFSRFAANRGEPLSRLGVDCGEPLTRFGADRAESDARAAALDEARRAYDIAIGLESDPAVRNFLLARQRQLP
jgi:RNA polymerase sigma-70 factor (ECF subfamily)